MFRNLLGLAGLVMIIVVAFTACTPATAPETVTGDKSAQADYRNGLEGYRLGPGDEVSITIFEEENLSGNYELNGRGIIDLPLVSEIRLAGLTSGQAADLIKQRYEQGYLNDPKISLSIVEYRPFFILGEVRSPGRYAFDENMTVIEAVALAQGFTYRANQKKIEIMRKIGQDPKYIFVDKNAAVMPGDVIRVKERFF